MMTNVMALHVKNEASVKASNQDEADQRTEEVSYTAMQNQADRSTQIYMTQQTTGPYTASARQSAGGI